ncbi:MAG TPA: tetratricopeptide repeat protein [Bacteroidales bacterium]|nr:tetratricopeptide repeat protein [Bacteroidales bacterium]HPR58562.1 tetratricopeptide repeat protein [Bacteroidales bacterium]
MAKKSTKAEENIQAVEEALGKSERFIEENQKPITIILLVIVALVLGYFGFQRFYVQPKEKSAQADMFMAEKYFAQDSLDLALNGDGINSGFLDIASDYKFTKSASLANYYAGAIYMKKGDYENAIDHLKKYKSKDDILRPMALGAIGDAYVELGNNNKAISYYLKAADISNNELSSPVFMMKAGWTYELMEEYQKAIDIYNKIRTTFPQSQEARELEKYIARAEGLLKK